jgi:nucleotide-binding universal stress UspA family protein
MIVIGYDGSPDARAAIQAAALLTDRRALVVNVWLPPLASGTPMLPLGGAGAALPPEAAFPQPEQGHEVVAEGVALAEGAGLSAEPLVVEGESTRRTGQLLADLAEERGAVAIVVGRRGRSRLEAAVLGSVSDAVVRASSRPVLVVPASKE